MRCQHCCEKEAVKKVNYITKDEPQYADMCEECASDYTLDEARIEG